jgi:hypothetical protein
MDDILHAERFAERFLQRAANVGTHIRPSLSSSEDDSDDDSASSESTTDIYGFGTDGIDDDDSSLSSDDDEMGEGMYDDVMFGFWPMWENGSSSDGLFGGREQQKKKRRKRLLLLFLYRRGLIESTGTYREPKLIRDRPCPQSLLDASRFEKLFEREYRMSYEAFDKLYKLLLPDLVPDPRNRKNDTIDPLAKLMMTLRMLAGGSYLCILRNFRVHPATFYKCFHQVLRAISCNPHVGIPEWPSDVQACQRYASEWAALEGALAWIFVFIMNGSCLFWVF